MSSDARLYQSIYPPTPLRRVSITTDLQPTEIPLIIEDNKWKYRICQAEKLSSNYLMISYICYYADLLIEPNIILKEPI